MLVLTRKPGERLYVGDDVTISVLEVRGNRVRIGIEAPASTHIMRAELRNWDGPDDPKRVDRRTTLLTH